MFCESVVKTSNCVYKYLKNALKLHVLDATNRCSPRYSKCHPGSLMLINPSVFHALNKHNEYIQAKNVHMILTNEIQKKKEIVDIPGLTV